MTARAAHADVKQQAIQQCEVHFYLGQWQLLAGDKAGALTSLDAALELCPKSLPEHSAALHELKRLGR